MTPSDKMDAATGIVTITLGALSGSFSPEDFHAWGTTFMSLSPFVLILYLLWRTRQLDIQHKMCSENNIKLQEQVVLAYRAIQDIQLRRKLPAEADFVAGNFSLSDHC